MFLIISHAQVKKEDNKLFTYGPYAREMNLWFKHVDRVEMISPGKIDSPDAIDIELNHSNLNWSKVPAISFTSPLVALISVLKLPWIGLKIAQAMRRADHIHLRCPGNMGLLGAMIQIFFPSKSKTAKYAGNWDWNSKQPWSYRLQQYILRSTFLTKNMKVLVYGEWPDRNKNILPFYTATYSKDEDQAFDKPLIDDKIRLIFVGGLNRGKRPHLALETLGLLIQKGLNAELTVCGDGPERSNLERIAEHRKLQSNVIFLGNVDAGRVKECFQQAHFLLFASKSEGWPKVVAESMWWGCIPITTAVSCVPQMVGNGSRGVLVEADSNRMYKAVIDLLRNHTQREEMVKDGIQWSRQFTLERFEKDAANLLMP